MKNIFLTLLLVAANSAFPGDSCQPSSQHDLTDGCRQFGGYHFGVYADEGEETTISAWVEELRVKQTISEPASIFIKTQTLRFPETGRGDDFISCIRVKDLVGKGNGGCPTIISGGKDLKEVTLQFTSQRGRRMEFLVEIYTKHQ